ncbi:hypothetical protein [Streptomyces sp. NPDC088146]|uniref:hypothetical protein n=1 Tax=Streptomyces sp. NPDC088146 TaxID=3365829 RepID=UPI0038006CFF
MGKFDVDGHGVTDKPGDLDGDGQPGLLTVDSANRLQLHSGTGQGRVDTPFSPNTSVD